MVPLILLLGNFILPILFTPVEADYGFFSGGGRPRVSKFVDNAEDNGSGSNLPRDTIDPNYGAGNMMSGTLLDSDVNVGVSKPGPRRRGNLEMVGIIPAPSTKRKFPAEVYQEGIGFRAGKLVDDPNSVFGSPSFQPSSKLPRVRFIHWLTKHNGWTPGKTSEAIWGMKNHKAVPFKSTYKKLRLSPTQMKELSL